MVIPKVTRGCWLGYQHFMFMMHGKMDVNDSDLTSCLETGVGIVIALRWTLSQERRTSGKYRPHLQYGK